MKDFKYTLKAKQKELGFTSKELAKLALVPESLLSGIQSENRIIGEKQAYRIASALNLAEKEQRNFIFIAMNESNQRLLESSRTYPVEILNSLPSLLRNNGIPPKIVDSASLFSSFVEIGLNSGDVLRLHSNLTLY